MRAAVEGVWLPQPEGQVPLAVERVRRQVVVPQSARNRYDQRLRPQLYEQSPQSDFGSSSVAAPLASSAYRVASGVGNGLDTYWNSRQINDNDFVIPARHTRTRSLEDADYTLSSARGQGGGSVSADRLARKRSARQADLIQAERETDHDISRDNFRAHKRYLTEAFARELGSLNLDTDPDTGNAEQQAELGPWSDSGTELCSDAVPPLGATPPGRAGMLGCGLRRGLTVFDDLQSLEHSGSTAARLLSGVNGPLPAGMVVCNPSDANVLYREPAGVSALFGTPGTVFTSRSAGSAGVADPVSAANGGSPSAFSVGSAPPSSGSRARRNTVSSDGAGGWGAPAQPTAWRNASTEMVSYDSVVGDLDSDVSEEYLVFPDGRRVLRRRDGQMVDLGCAPCDSRQFESELFEME